MAEHGGDPQRRDRVVVAGARRCDGGEGWPERPERAHRRLHLHRQQAQYRHHERTHHAGQDARGHSCPLAFHGSPHHSTLDE
jgi:hypothetical protein